MKKRRHKKSGSAAKRITEQHAIRLDAKTIIFIDKDKDAEKEKKKYLILLSKLRPERGRFKKKK